MSTVNDAFEVLNNRLNEFEDETALDDFNINEPIWKIRNYFWNTSDTIEAVEKIKLILSRIEYLIANNKQSYSKNRIYMVGPMGEVIDGELAIEPFDSAIKITQERRKEIEENLLDELDFYHARLLKLLQQSKTNIERSAAENHQSPAKNAFSSNELAILLDALMQRDFIKNHESNKTEVANIYGPEFWVNTRRLAIDIGQVHQTKKNKQIVKKLLEKLEEIIEYIKK